MRRLLGALPTAAQVAGGGAALAGLYLVTSLGVTLLVGGVLVAAVGTLAEIAGQPARKGGR